MCLRWGSRGRSTPARHVRSHRCGERCLSGAGRHRDREPLTFLNSAMHGLLPGIMDKGRHVCSGDLCIRLSGRPSSAGHSAVTARGGPLGPGGKAQGPQPDVRSRCCGSREPGRPATSPPRERSPQRQPPWGWLLRGRPPRWWWPRWWRPRLTRARPAAGPGPLLRPSVRPPTTAAAPGPVSARVPWRRCWRTAREEYAWSARTASSLVRGRPIAWSAVSPAGTPARGPRPHAAGRARSWSPPRPPAPTCRRRSRSATGPRLRVGCRTAAAPAPASAFRAGGIPGPTVR